MKFDFKVIWSVEYWVEEQPSDENLHTYGKPIVAKFKNDLLTIQSLF